MKTYHRLVTSTFGFALATLFGCDPDDLVQKSSEAQENDPVGEHLLQEQRRKTAEASDEGADGYDQFSEDASLFTELSLVPDPAAGGVCCALCWNRWNYYQMVGVTQNCAYWASAWCSQNNRGGLWDAAWGSCNPPPGGF